LPYLYGLSRHHEGVDMGTTLSNYAGQGIKGVNWLTFLHPNFVQRMGGNAALEKALELPDVTLLELPSGVMIQAGAAPEIGDTNAQEGCPAYHRVGRVLAPIRDTRFPGLIGPAGSTMSDKEVTQLWLNRFDV
jgi:hypothetical protein